MDKIILSILILSLVFIVEAYTYFSSNPFEFLKSNKTLIYFILPPEKLYQNIKKKYREYK